MGMGWDIGWDMECIGDTGGTGGHRGQVWVLLGGASLVLNARLVQVLRFGCCCPDVDAGAVVWVSQQGCDGASATVWVLKP